MILLLQMPMAPELQQQAFDWWKLITPIIGTVVGGVVMLLINQYREGSKQYSNRIDKLERQVIEADRVKILEIQGINHENRFTQVQQQHEAYAATVETRFRNTELKLDKVDKLSDDVNRLTNDVGKLSTELNGYGKTMEKVDKKVDELLMRTKD